MYKGFFYRRSSLGRSVRTGTRYHSIRHIFWPSQGWARDVLQLWGHESAQLFCLAGSAECVQRASQDVKLLSKFFESSYRVRKSTCMVVLNISSLKSRCQFTVVDTHLRAVGSANWQHGIIRFTGDPEALSLHAARLAAIGLRIH